MMTSRNKVSRLTTCKKTVTNHGTRIETLETKAKATPPPQTQTMPSEVKVVLPDDIARKSDIEEAVTKITRKCNAGDSRTPQPVTVTVSALDALEKWSLTRLSERRSRMES